MNRSATTPIAPLALGGVMAFASVSTANGPAFPGAVGFCANGTGGRGRVITVINLNDSGPGSMRVALDAKGPRTVVFRVSGNLALKSKLKNDDILIAGQTAPGHGICLQNHGFAFSAANNVITRHKGSLDS